MLARYDYLPCGEPASTPLAHDGFGGKERDAETGSGSQLALNYFGARHLHAASGRFTTVDPLLGAGAIVDPQRWNGYAYALNNPHGYVDPDGRSPKAAIMAFKVAHALYKGYDVYSTVSGIVDATDAIVSSESTWGERAWGVANLVGELSGAKDVYKGASLGIGSIRVTRSAARIKLLEINKNNARANLIRYTRMNGDPKQADAHHVFPQKFREEFFEPILRRAQLNMDHPMFLRWWEVSEHRGLQDEYNSRWEAFFRLYGTDATPEQVLEEGRRIMKDFGMDVYY